MAAKKNAEEIHPKIFQILGPYVDNFTLRSIYASGPRGHFYTKLFVVDKMKLRIEQVLADFRDFHSIGITLQKFGDEHRKKFKRAFMFDGRGIANFIGIYYNGTYHVKKDKIWYTPNHSESDSESESEPEPVTGIHCNGTYHVKKEKIWFTPNHPEFDSESEPEPVIDKYHHITCSGDD